MAALYALWIPIIQFSSVKGNLNKKNITLKSISNKNWSWLEFKYQEAFIVIDSLGYIYLELERDNKEDVLSFIEQILDDETKSLLNETFLNTEIQFHKNPESSKDPIFDLMDSITIKVSSFSNLKIEYITSKLLHDEEELCNRHRVKFSLDTQKPIEDTTFYQILNRNFCQLLNKSIYFTHGLEFEKGEIYDFSIFHQTEIEPLLKNIQKLNISLKINSISKQKILAHIIKKALQETIEEKAILHFLQITKSKYLDRTIEKITLTNDALAKLSSYLLATPHISSTSTSAQGFDEEDIEVFTENILYSIPKFHVIEAKIKESYYIKVGNTTTNLKIEKDEMITNTLFYTRWQSSIRYFIEMATNIKESLKIYHQNKNLKELEDISYNANYQADIEDIRDLKNSDKNSLELDKKTQNYITIVLAVFAMISLVGDAPLYEIKDIDGILDHFKQHFINLVLYATIIGGSFFLYKIYVALYTKRHCFFSKTTQNKNKNIYHFEESDYDKHEHRSNKSLYTFNKDGKTKVTISYNDTVSAYTLMKKLKALKISKYIGSDLKTFSIFPELLQNTPLEKEYTYRENYRISRNDKVTTKIMLRYKITNLPLIEFIELFKNDDFKKDFYDLYIKNEVKQDSDFSKHSLDQCLSILEEQKETQLNLYTVYSFTLKLNRIDGNNYDYLVVKDQFRVHYHINQLYYKDQEDLRKQQECLGQIVYIYFLARFKNFAKA